LNDARTSGGGIYFKPTRIEGNPPTYTAARFRVSVEAMKIVKGRPPSGKEYFLLETIVKTSSNPAQPEGARVNWMVGLDLEAAPGNIKALLIAAAGLDLNSAKDAKEIANEDWDAAGEAAVDESNPFKGTLLDLEVFFKLKKNRTPEPGREEDPKGPWFTMVNFAPVKAAAKAAK